MKKLLILLFVLAATVSFAQNSRHRWKVVVIVPETHISRPHIPDPAVETELNRQLIDAGYKVIDQSRVRALISNAIEDRLMRKDAMARAEAMRLARKVGADIVVTGEAFTVVALRQQTDTDLGRVENIYCRARVELKAYRVDTAEMVFADAITKTGRPEISEELSSKTALQDAAEEIGPDMIQKLDKLGTSNTVTISVEVRNVSFSQGELIRDVLRRAANAVEISEGDYDASTWSFDVTVTRARLPRVSVGFEQDPRLRKMKLRIQQANKSKIILNKK